MSAVAHPGAAPLDRRTVLRAGAVLAAAGAVATVAGRAPSLLGQSTPGAAAATAADWLPTVGHAVGLHHADGRRSTAQLVDVRDVSNGDPLLTGEAYSLLFAAPALARTTAEDVRVVGGTAPNVRLTLLPVNGDGSWEATIDRRTPTDRGHRHV